MRILILRRKWIVRLVIALIVIGVTSILALRYPESVKNLYRIFPSFSLPKEEHWIFEVHSTFSRCGHIRNTKQEYASKKEIIQMVEANPEYRLTDDQPYRVICRELKTGWCDSCDTNRFLGIENRHVAIMRGTPAQPGPAVEITQIDIGLLPEVERSDLKAGIPFRGEKEKLQLLEGLNGLIIN